MPVRFGDSTEVEFKWTGGSPDGPGNPHEEPVGQGQPEEAKPEGPASEYPPRWNQWDSSMLWTYWTSIISNSDWATNMERTEPRRIDCKVERENWDHQGRRRDQGDRIPDSESYGYRKTKTEDRWNPGRTNYYPESYGYRKTKTEDGWNPGLVWTQRRRMVPRPGCPPPRLAWTSRRRVVSRG